jgi:hypothetical protein
LLRRTLVLFTGSELADTQSNYRFYPELAIQNLKIRIFLLFTFDFTFHTLTFAVLSQNGGMVTTVEVETKFKG